MGGGFGEALEAQRFASVKNGSGSSAGTPERSGRHCQLSAASGTPRVPVNPKTGEIIKADREFGGEIGLDLRATLTGRPRRGRKRKPVPPSAGLTEI